MIVRPVCEAETALIEAAIVPAPSAAYTVMLGCAAMSVRDPADVDFSCVVQVCAPVEEVAVAPGPAPAVEPYVTVNVLPAASVREETVIVWPETVSVPELAVEYPAFAPVVDGALQPAGAATVTEPLEMPPAGEVYVKVIVRPVCDAETTLIDAAIVPPPSAA